MRWMPTQHYVWQQPSNGFRNSTKLDSSKANGLSRLTSIQVNADQAVKPHVHSSNHQGSLGKHECARSQTVFHLFTNDTLDYLAVQWMVQPQRTPNGDPRIRREDGLIAARRIDAK